MPSNFENLSTAVIEASASDYWAAAVLEWEITDAREDANADETCVCGKTGLRYLFEISNLSTGRVLYPIGSECIHLFEVSELDTEVNVRRQLMKLRAAFARGQFITLKGGLFSRSLLRYLYQQGVFEDENDFVFILTMFNLRTRVPTLRQSKKISAIILSSIKDYALEG